MYSFVQPLLQSRFRKTGVSQLQHTSAYALNSLKIVL